MRKIFLLITVAGLAMMGACEKDNSSAVTNASFADNLPSAGQGGSLARFTIANNFLYIVDESTLHAYSLADREHPKLTSSVSVGLNIETIFPYRDKLFIGSQQAMYIFSISNPAQPTNLGEASHLRACDPVVANDKFAYVTVRSGNRCGGSVNALYTYNVTDVFNPKLLSTSTVASPWGLGLMDNTLYVCNADKGMGIYAVAVGSGLPYLQKTITGGVFYDVIPTADSLLFAMMQTGTNIYKVQPQYDLTLLSSINN